MGIVGLLVPFALAVALGAWSSGLDRSRHRRTVGVTGALVAIGLVGYALLGGPPGAALERAGVGCLFALPCVAAALVTFRRRMWRRPWLVLLLSLVAYATGFILAMNLWLWIGLPH